MPVSELIGFRHFIVISKDTCYKLTLNFMDWQLTMDGMQIVAVIVSLLCFIPFGKWLMTLNFRYFLKRKYQNIGNEKYWSCGIGVVLANVLVMVMINSWIARVILLAGEILIFSLFYLWAKGKSTTIANKISSIAEDDTSYTEKVTKNLKMARIMLTLTGGAIVYLAIFPLLLWLLPDVAYIGKKGNVFNVKLRYELPYVQDFKPGGSYIVNDTPDTLLRVIVRYAFPERDKSNVFGVTAKYPPHATTKMIDKADYILRPIPLYLAPSVSRGRSYPRKMVFIVDKEELWDFQSAKMGELGLKRNREVAKDSISEPINKTVIDTKLKSRPTTAKSSFYLYHYDGC